MKRLIIEDLADVDDTRGREGDYIGTMYEKGSMTFISAMIAMQVGLFKRVS